MLPFAIQISHGEPVYEQLLAAVRRALFTGQLQDGDAFPSVRALSQELRISPTTAHKVVAMLKNEGVLVSRPGVGMVVATGGLPNRDGRREMISETTRKLVREAKDLSLELSDVTESLREAWDSNGLPDGPPGKDQNTNNTNL